LDERMSTERSYFECPIHGGVTWRAADDRYSHPVGCPVMTRGSGEPAVVRCDQPLTKHSLTFLNAAEPAAAHRELRGHLLAEFRARYTDPIDDWDHMADAVMDTLAALDLLPAS
jgi:hypothetical protein